MKILTRTVVILSLVSFFTDIASEMLYPVMPVYLRSIGFSFFLIGLLEGFAEATAGLSKGYFGRLSDAKGRRLPFVQLGYGLSALSKPMMALLTVPAWIFSARFLDRLGKGIRTGARDALLSAEAVPENKGRVFGFHRAADTFGAALGPLLALIFLSWYPGRYRELFMIAFIPGLLGLLSSVFIREKALPPDKSKKPRGNFFAFLGYWREASPGFRRLVAPLLVFTLVNSSDAFLLLMMKANGAGDTDVIKIYIFYNLVFALLAYPLGHAGDRFGFRKTLTAGLLVFALVYGGMPYARGNIAMLCLFFLYGLYAAATEGISKAWITNLVPRAEAGSAIGFYTGLGSICTMVASAATGFLWTKFSPQLAFGVSAAGATLVALWLFAGTRDRNEERKGL